MGPVEKQKEELPSQSGSSQWFGQTLDWLSKMVPAFATIAVVFIAHNFQTSMTTTTLLSEREKADSELRARMFSDLIGPIAGPTQDRGLDADRERLLGELLALNFHEHFELKPLLLHIDRRLATEIATHGGKVSPDARESLRSVARRVISRQVALLTKTNTSDKPEDSSQLVRMDIVGPVPAGEKIARFPQERPNELVRKFDEPIEVLSPTKSHKLYVIFDQLDVANQALRVDVSVFGTQKGDEIETAHYDFMLSWFDFPFTDNTLLSDGTRFAFVLDQMDDLTERLSKEEKSKLSVAKVPRARVNLLWFPRDYFAARERPTNHRQFRERLGLDFK